MRRRYKYKRRHSYGVRGRRRMRKKRKFGYRRPGIIGWRM